MRVHLSMRVTFWAAALLLCAAPVPASAEIYRWTDAAGRLHFSQSLDQVPPQYRKQAKDGAEASSESSRLQTYSSGAAAPAPRGAERGGTLRVPFTRYGTLMKVEAVLNDSLSVPFYVDTGASGISLPHTVADRLGITLGPDTRQVFVRTANGVVSRAVVRLDSVQLRGARVEDLDATLNPSMDIGLLGGTFFNNFIYRVDAAENVITLQLNDGIKGGVGADEWRRRFARAREPLARLEAYLDGKEITRSGRRAELEHKLIDLRGELEELELAANRAGVPAAWRE